MVRTDSPEGRQPLEASVPTHPYEPKGLRTMRQTDQMLARYAGELEERQTFIDGVVEDAEKASRDLNPQEMELVTRARDRISTINGLVGPLAESSRIATESRSRMAELAPLLTNERAPSAVEYRSAGEYVLDYWRAGLGVEDARNRLDTFNRAAAHQTTGDNPGLLPAQMIQPVLNWVDQSRPVVNFLGPRNLPAGSWNRPRISQHTNVAPQAGEKTELVSRKMIIGMVPVTAATYGGYVNVSRQNIDWSQPAIMDLVINDLAGVYAQETEKALCVAIDGATTAGPVMPTGPSSVAEVNKAIWAAVGSVYAATKGAGQVAILVSPDMLGVVGPAFPAVNPSNSISTGFQAADFATGNAGNISGLPVVVSAGFDAGTMIVMSSAAVEVYEDRIGSLQVVEPSVLGVQVAYAGYFADVIIEPTAIIEITKTP
jgi:HK97 family phage major capsid protein